MINVKTVQEHKNYLEEIVKLSLFAIAVWNREHPEEDLIYTIHERTPLLNHTVFNRGHILADPEYSDDKWPELREKLKDIYNKSSNPSSFEDNGFKLLRPYIFGRAERDVHDLNNTDLGDSWITYELNQSTDYMEVHMRNSLYPKSFLADKKYFYDKLKNAVSVAEKNGFRGLWSRSWLNCNPAWIKLMPDEWNKSHRKKSWDIKWHLGFWGQFLTSNHCFNVKNGELFRKYGKVPYPYTYAEASLKAFNSILEQFE